MRICLVCTEKLPVPPVRGGAIQTYIDGVLPWLRRDHAVTVICRRDPDLPDCEERDGVRFIRVPAGSSDGYAAGAAAAIAWEEPFDWVVIYNRPAFVPMLAACAGPARLALSLHNDMLAPDRVPPGEARLILERVEAVACISDYIRGAVGTLYPEYGDRLRTIRSGVDPALYQPVWAADPSVRMAVRARLGLPEAAPVVLHVSRLSPNKGNHLVVQAMAEVRRTNPDARLLVVGSSRYGSDHLEPYGAQVREEALGLLGGAVCFTGFVPPAGVPELYQAADLFVCASQWEEPLARVHYEAMAAGLPIVTTERGGNAEVVEEGGTGFLVRPYNDPSAFARCIGDLLTDSGLRERMGRRGRELAETRYTFDRVAAELLDLLGGR